LFTDELKDFIYFDVDGIDQLYSQTVERLEVSQVETKNRALAGKVGVSGTLKSVFLGFLALARLAARLKQHTDLCRESKFGELRQKAEFLSPLTQKVWTEMYKQALG
jgi:hypothetical protein